jgi:hypothetical protein
MDRYHALIRRVAPFAALLAGALAAGPAGAQPAQGWQFGAVLDVAHTSRALALGGRDQGLQLGHSDLTASGPLGALATARLTAVFATHDGRLEKEIEEAWLETTRLPAGLVARAGRFASQIGYLNAQHPHADDFVERPLLYRAFFGGHWNDDGVRLNWTAPTPFFLQLGVEAFRGQRLVEETAEATGNPGIATVVAKFGGDIGASHSWQAGVSHIRNRREAAVEEEAGSEAGHDHAHHHHHHGAQFSGRRTWMVDATWKWAPGGNSRAQQLRAHVEAARIEGLNRYARGSDRHEANAVALLWRFRPDWETGARADWLRVRIPHGDHFHSGLLREVAAMLVWKPSHMQSLRLQLARQYDAVGFDVPASRSVQLQYVLAFGAHPAHSF